MHTIHGEAMETAQEQNKHLVRQYFEAYDRQDTESWTVSIKQ